MHTHPHKTQAQTEKQTNTDTDTDTQFARPSLPPSLPGESFREGTITIRQCNLVPPPSPLLLPHAHAHAHFDKCGAKIKGLEKSAVTQRITAAHYILIPSLMHSPTYSLTHTFSHSLIHHPLIRLLIHSPTHSLTYSFSPPLYLTALHDHGLCYRFVRSIDPGGLSAVYDRPIWDFSLGGKSGSLAPSLPKLSRSGQRREVPGP